MTTQPAAQIETREEFRVTRYDEEGRLFHTCLTPTADVFVSEHGGLCVDMPMRFWIVLRGGSVELRVEEKGKP